jgi:preprotein translocase subunit SecG
MTARGAADFLTRTTSISATIFVCLSIVLAALAANTGRPSGIDASLAQPQPGAPATGPALSPTAPVTPPATAPATGNQSGGVPLAQ